MRVKVSIYVDKELWQKLERYAKRINVDVGSLIEDLIKNEIVDEVLDEAVGDMLKGFCKDVGIDFQPVEPIQGTVSELLREKRWD